MSKPLSIKQVGDKTQKKHILGADTVCGKTSKAERGMRLFVAQRKRSLRPFARCKVEQKMRLMTQRRNQPVTRYTRSPGNSCRIFFATQSVLAVFCLALPALKVARPLHNFMRSSAHSGFVSIVSRSRSQILRY